MSAKAKNKPKILLVDDEASNLELLHRTLYRDYEVFQANNGLQALEILATVSDIAVIVSDQRMPLMSGTELLSLTATQYPDIIRIILTAYTDVEDLVDAINSGKVFKYVTKPWKTDELRTLVSQAVDTHNVLKARTTELCRTLRQESLLNAVINTIRSRTSEAEILQTIVETVGQIFDVSYCILRPLHDGRLADEWYLYQNKKNQPIEVRGKKKENKVRMTAETAGLSPLSSDADIPERLLAETIWETTDIQVINDVATDALFQEMTPEVAQRRQTYAALDIRSSLVVPLMFRLDALAILALHQCGQPRIWKDDEVQLGFMVADQASLSLSQVRAYEQVQALAKREALINTITSAIRSSLNPKDIFAAITQQLGEALQVDGCALSLWTENDEYVQCVGLYETGRSSVVRSESPDFPPLAALSQEEAEVQGSRGARHQQRSRGAEEQRNPGVQEPSLPRSVVPISGNPVHQQLLATQKPVVIRDLQDTPELSILDIPVGIDQTQEQFLSPSRALLVVPLLSDGKIIGSISLRHHHNPRRWLPNEIDLAQAVAAQAAIAVQQSRLYQTTRQQAERLLELDRLKTEFFQNISHEFRTPLTLTIGPLESAVQHQKSLSLEQAEIALRNCRRLLRLVNQLLNLQRLDAGRMQPTFRPCNFIEFVEQTVDTFRPYCEKKGLRLETRINPCSPLYLDLEKFDKVLYNLLSNAMKFTNAPGIITVTVEQSGNYCMLRVKDTGIGIRNDQIPHLFERFRQAEGSVSRSYEGSGLGLALAKELVELHGGQITVESVYEQGSSFTVWLPIGCSHLPPDKVIEVPTGVMPSRVDVELADLELETDAEIIDEIFLNLPTSTAATDGLGRMQEGIVRQHPLILMVDDNHDLRHYVASILKEQQYRTILARNGAEGFQLAQKYQPDLIVADLMMPLVSGLDMIRMIRESGQLKGIPIILLTAKVDEDTRVEGVEQGADAYLGKPFNDRELLALVHNLLALKENERRIKELNSYLTESVLKRFLPPGMVQKAARGELQLDLSPEPRLITILFSDIVGFTQMSNNLRSRRVAEILNEYLDAMTQAVFEHSGTVDKFVGDAIIAIFGAPEESTPNEQVANALAAAKEMQRSLIQLNEKWQAQGLPEVKFRCGIHQGTAVVGMFGNAERSDYTAIGPSVNIAARLQEASEPNRILVSAAVADYLNDDEIIKYQPLKLKGIDETVLTFLVKN